MATRFAVSTPLSLAIVLAGLAAAPQPTLAAEPTTPVIDVWLGDPIELDSEDRFETPTERIDFEADGSEIEAQGAGAGAAVDRFDRLDVADFYHCEYLPSQDYLARMSWVGDVASCDAGSVSASFHDDTLRRINYYRAMTGLNADITFDPDKNAKSQEAALIMSRNCGLSHTPITSHPEWDCLTADGDEAAGASNLSLANGISHTGPAAVDGQMRDAGGNNAPVGHRRWLLYPRAVEMGNGGIPGGGQCSAGVVWVIGGFGPRPASPEWVSWPNAGFVPYSLAFDRWSFSLVGADFDAATVTMSQDGTPVPVTIVHPTPTSPAAGFGDPTLVWEPSGIPATAPTSDLAYEVTISGITGAAQSSYSYDVVLIDPTDAGLPLELTGTTTPLVGLSNIYLFAPSSASGGYTLRARAVDPSAWKEGAETTDPNRLIDGTDPSYDLTTDALTPQAGVRSFHLAFPDFVDQQLELDRTILPSATSELSFHYLRRFSSVANTISAEISTDDGTSWNAIWSTTGVCTGSCSSSSWDDSWQPVTLSLGDQADLPIRVRFVYRYVSTAFLGTDPTSHGIFLDEISVSQAGTLGAESLTSVAAGATQVEFVPAAEETYLLDLRAELTCFASSYGPVLSVVPEPRFATALLAALLLLFALGRRDEGRHVSSR